MTGNQTTDAKKGENTFFKDPKEITAIISSTFSGKKEKLQNFIRKCTLAHKMGKTEWEPSLLVFIMSKIRDQAGIELAASPEIPQTWENLKKFLVSKYEDQQTFEQIFNELTLTSQKPSEDVSSYASRI